MPRKTKCRRVASEPGVTCFKPYGVHLGELKEVIITVDELEAIRLKDMVGLEQEDCAQQMRISRQTFQRILNEARLKIATSLIEGNSIRIEGGDYCLGGRYCRRRGRMLSHQEACYGHDYSDQVKGGDLSVSKIAITSAGDNLASLVDGRFGRCAFFVICQPDSSAIEAILNQSQQGAHGAGTGASQLLIRHNVSTVLTNRIGPKAFAVLREAGIKVYQCEENQKVGDVLEQFRNNQLSELTSANN